MFNGIEHSAIASPDPQRLAGWYRDVLEFRIVRVKGNKVFLRGLNGSLLEIIPSMGDRQPAGRLGRLHRPDRRGDARRGRPARQGLI